MAASDNVVRSGLTPKFKDVDTLVNMLTYNHASADSQLLQGVPFKGSSKTWLYDPPIQEFAVLKTELEEGDLEITEPLQGPSILIVTAGSKLLLKSQGESLEADSGHVFFIGANVPLHLEAKQGPITCYRAFCE